ncbi:DEAD/DEAH box helicase [Nocardia cyriacigeorgica]|uniref:DEAD/DEAH box helicase n=1 Tax=Nocardia cyriacigeorgica TaxID=135487 RepID=UPI002458C489|nr:AAA domain-containing protein [Nocardia cyriacigeorgica]
MSGSEHAARLVRFWRAVEIFSPQPVPKLSRLAGRGSGAVVIDLPIGEAAPWDEDHELHRLRRLPSGMTWQFTVYGGLYGIGAVREALVGAFGADLSEPDGRQEGTTAVFAFTVDADGALLENSPTLSACAWAMSRLESPGFRNRAWLDGFGDDEAEFIEALNKLAPARVGAERRDSRSSRFSEARSALGRQARGAAREAVAKGAGTAATVGATAAATALGGPVVGGIAGAVAGTFVEKLIARQSPPSDPAGQTGGGPPSSMILTSDDLHEFTNDLVSALGVDTTLGATGIRIYCKPTPKRYAGESAVDQDFLNSFIADDLGRVEAAVDRGDLGAALRGYLTDTRDIAVDQRIDVRENLKLVLAELGPTKFPTGRWPGDIRRPLVLSQQFAVNRLMSELADGAGVFAVNGPPGTGKTTLLRDVLAAIVVERAGRLAELGSPAAAFTREIEKVRLKDSNYQIAVRRVRPELTGFEVVLATASNDAATNVTSEIPALAAVDGGREQALTVDYFTELASLVLDAEAWGLVAAPLGNLTYRNQFGGRFWFGNGSSPSSNGDNADNEQPERPSIAMKDVLARASQAPESIPDWREAVTAFNAARAEAQRLAAERQAVADMIAELPGLQTAVQDALADIEDAHRDQEHWRGENESARARRDTAREAYQQASNDLDEHARRQPGFWVSLATWFQAGRRWNETNDQLGEVHKQAKAALHACEAEVSRTADSLAAATALREQRVADHRHAADRVDTANSAIRQAVEAWGTAVPFGPDIADENTLQLCPVWSDEAFTAARNRVLLAALALHKAFILNAAAQIRSNLAVAVGLIRSKTASTPAPETIAAAWQTLFLVVPMVSTTFASLPRLFGGLQREALGWLFIDEAGQATPQQAVGGLWRARRAVIVGDPQQLEPVVTLPSTAQEALLRHHRLDPEWLPDITSAQRVADRLARYGTALPTPDGAGTVWVGAPLRVHRRCDRPMFEVSNRIAYGGDLMVFGTSTREPFPGRNTWIDVRSGEGSSKWSPAEGAELGDLLRTLTSDLAIPREEIRVISPFREVVQGCERVATEVLGADFARRNVGTVHTVQGQECDVVIMVLGTSPSREGARRWAAAKPNLLNVAVSRAKRRFYVIGNRELWARQQYFGDLAVLLHRE